MRQILDLSRRDLADVAVAVSILIIAAGTAVLVLRMFSLQVQDLTMLLSVSIVVSAALLLKSRDGSSGKKMESVLWTILGFSFVRLGTPETILVLTLAHVIQWLRQRRSSTLLLGVQLTSYILAAHFSGTFIESAQANLPASYLSYVWGILGRMTVFMIIHYVVSMSHTILSVPGLPLKSAAIEISFAVINLSAMSFGAAAAILWDVNPLATLLIVPAMVAISTTVDLPRLQQRAITDSKTGLFNPDYFMLTLKRELARAKRTSLPLTVVMADLDHLRAINNRHGHLAGDKVLIDVAWRLRHSFREYDVVARFGGEEFAILMPGVTPVEIFSRIKSVRNQIEVMEVELPGSNTPLKITMSFGLAGTGPESMTPEQLIHNADTALYQSKEGGRNRVTMYSNQDLKGVEQRRRETTAARRRAAGLITLLSQSYRLLTDFLPIHLRLD
jgi:diguanylate cyclase (GGDEF)-like protein